MRGERHARTDSVDHDLHQDRHRRALPPAVPIVVSRDAFADRGCKASPHRVTQPGTGDVEIGLVQAGVRSIRQVLGRTGRTHREPIPTHTPDQER
jgi:hypothetical protein